MLTKSIITILLSLSMFAGSFNLSMASELSDAIQPQTHSWFCAESDTEQEKKEKKEGAGTGDEEPDCD